MGIKKEVWYVKTTTCAIITSREGDRFEFLLTCRGFPPYQGKWCLPGGHINKFESARDAIVREVKEEVGLDFKAEFLGYFDEIIPVDNIHAVVMIFGGATSGIQKAQPGEVTDIQWFTLEEIQKMDLAFQHNEILEVYFGKIND